MFRNEDGQVCAHVEKDRTHTHSDNEIIEDPTLLDWQTVIDKTAKHANYVIKNDLTKAVEVEQDLYEKEILGKVGSPVTSSTSDETTKSEEETEKLKSEIMAKRSALSPTDKTKKKAELAEAGLPGNLKNITDIEILKKYLEIIEK